jgi:hypothetical protein
MKEIKTRETQGADAEAALAIRNPIHRTGAPLLGRPLGGGSLRCID